MFALLQTMTVAYCPTKHPDSFCKYKEKRNV